MIAASMLAAGLLQVIAPDSVRVCAVDAATGLPLVGATVSRVDSARGEASATRRMSSTCITLRAGQWTVRRVGFHAAHITLNAADSLAWHVALRPLGWATLDTLRVQATSGRATLARTNESLTANEARRSGAASTAALVNQLPFANVRSARGESTVSLRGARREQVVATLDGMPLNDPSTGVADLSDIPLVAIGSASVTLGADPLGAGPGASGGVLALASSTDRLVAVRGGSLGQRSAEGAWSGLVGPTLLRVSARHGIAENDFPFINSAGAAPIREQRINNDESRSAGTLAITGSTWQAAGLVSRTDRGMVGAANVRTYDTDRSRVDRQLVRGQLARFGVQLIGGYRRFALDYRDPTRPTLDARSTAQVVELEARGDIDAQRARRASLAWRVGGGTDQVRATGGIAQSRNRGFAAWQSRWRTLGIVGEVGMRVDAIDGAGITPSWSIGAEREILAGVRLSARAAQAMRAPTLYDLYFSSPQRLSVPTLRPERVSADLEVGAHLAQTTRWGDLTANISLVSRETREAIVWFPGNFGWSPANVGLERLQGVESRVRLRPRWGELSAWNTWYDAELTSGALRIPTPYVPRWASGAQWTVTHRHASASVMAHASGRRPFTAGPRNPAFELPAVALVDVGVTHGLPHAIRSRHADASLTWSLENATNVAWQSVRGFPAPGRTWALAFTLRHHPPS